MKIIVVTIYEHDDTDGDDPRYVTVMEHIVPQNVGLASFMSCHDTLIEAATDAIAQLKAFTIE